MDPFARELLDRARNAHDPTDEDRVRVRTKLAARIGAGVLIGAGTAKAISSGWSWIVKALMPFLLVAGLVGYALLRARSGERTVVLAEAPTLPASPAVEPSAAPEPSESPVATVAPEDSAPPLVVPAPLPVRPAKPQPAASSDLEAEMGLLASAQSAIQRGDYATALAKLDEHQRLFPGGVLGEERTAARVVALCGAGRQAEARALASSFLAHHPSSPLAPRVRSSCAAQ